MLFFFILGKNPNLSIEELKAYFLRKNIAFSQIFYQGETAVFDIQLIDPLGGSFLDELGGTVKYGVVLGKEGIVKARERVSMFLRRKVAALGVHHGKRGKFMYGFSVYGDEPVRAFFDLGIAVKKNLERQSIKCRFVTAKTKELSSVVVSKNHLTEQNGAEIVFFKDAKSQGIYFGRTLAVQNFQEYGDRDYNRPNRNQSSGMIPPKLAQIMINLARAPSGGAILDPFCGCGTILAEAMLLGYTNLFGSDISEDAVRASRENIAWLGRKRKIAPIPSKHIFVFDAAGISTKIPHHSIDAIVTEPFLGPPMKGRESREKIQGIVHAISDLYKSALAEFKKVLKNDGRVVMAWPIFAHNKERLRLSLNRDLNALGFQPEYAVMDKSGEERTTLVYGRDGQRIEREIWVLKQN